MRVANLINGHWVGDGVDFAVADKFHLTDAYTVPAATPGEIEAALTAAKAYTPAPPPERAACLRRTAAHLEAQRDAVISAMVVEAGFPVKDAQGELARALATLRLSAEEATRIAGEVVPFDGAVTGRMGFTIRVPVGTVVAITPFNAPLNTPCHKLGPALAAGNAVILKPSEKTPGPAALLVDALLQAGFPPGAIQMLQGGPQTVEQLLADPRPDFFAFTGSTKVGTAIHKAAGLRRTQMELGSIASTIVMEDADLEAAVAKCVGSSFRKAGQVCTSIQTLYVARTAFEPFLDGFISGARALVAGNPADPETDVGPMISEEAAERVTTMLDGANVRLGGTRTGAVLAPTVLTDPQAAFLTREAFGPVVAVVPVDDLSDAIDCVNATPYGLATGLFTRDITAALNAAKRLHVGGVHINETSSSRVDLMPYGGVKASGFGQEGPRYAIREMTEERLITVSGLA